jgi:hypothetical protein
MWSVNNAEGLSEIGGCSDFRSIEVVLVSVLQARFRTAAL